ncbi:MAG: outer membrane lipoprotein carrier protein LolA [Paludibacteraceae bacterium]|nr:outer membrane lipoprotein carrier protein LolA [Paludibacteraceae bacterium]
MKRFTYSILILIISIIPVLAQVEFDAERVTRDLLTSLRQNAIRTNFILKITEKNKVNSQSNSGIFTLQGQKFVLETDELKVWFDGRTQWAYMEGSNEVSITEPTFDELASINPLAILSGYKAKSILSFSKKKSETNYIVEMKPKVRQHDFVLIELQINKNSRQPVSIMMMDKNRLTTTLSFSNYKKDVKVQNDTFVFNKLQYKNVIVNDLR